MTRQERPFRPLDDLNLSGSAESGKLTVDLSDRIDDHRSSQQRKAEAPKLIRDPFADGVQVAQKGGVDLPGALEVLTGWRTMTGGENVQAGKGKTVTMELEIPGEPRRSYVIPLDDIGDKKVKFMTDGKQVQAKQLDGTLWNSTYTLGWKKDKKGNITFVWQ